MMDITARRNANQALNVANTNFTNNLPNLFNKNSSNITTGKYIARDGTLSTDSSWNITHPIKVNPANTYYFTYDSHVDNQHYMCCFASDDTVSGNATFTYKGNYTIATLPANTAYIKLSYRTAIQSTFTVVNGSTALTTSVPFSLLTSGVYAFEGDSITYGANSGTITTKCPPANGTGYPALIQERLPNAKVYNFAVSGATITNYTPSNCISSRVATMTDDYDYLIMSGGYNDFGNNVALGSLSATYTDTFDQSTFYGALEYMFQAAVTNHPGRKLGFVITHKSTYSNWGNYVAAIKAACQKWSIPYLDLYNDSGLNASIPSIAAVYLDSLPLHPNEAGYRAFYNDKVYAWLQTL